MSIWLTRNKSPSYHARPGIVGFEADMTIAAASTRPHQQMPRHALRAVHHDVESVTTEAVEDCWIRQAVVSPRLRSLFRAMATSTGRA